MRCPCCGFENISGSDECESCLENLSSIDGVVPTGRVTKSLMEDPIAKLEPRDGIWVRRDASVLDAVREMNRNKVGCVFVGKERLEGILTERDVVFKVLAKGKKPADLPVHSVMTASPTTLDDDDSLAYALNAMSVGGFRHVPILRQGKPTGVISVRDILNYLAKLFS